MLEHNELLEKWDQVLNHEDVEPIKNPYKKAAVAVLLENLQNDFGKGRNLYEGPVPSTAMGGSSSTPGTGPLDTFEPIMISMLRRAAPQMINFDIMGTQAMAGPVAQIFSMRSRYVNGTGPEAFYGEANTQYGTVVSGNVNVLGQAHVGTLPGNTTVTSNLISGVYNYGTGMKRTQAEALGTTGNVAFPEMSFSIEKTSVEAFTRALKAEYTSETQQDMKALHGLDVDSELQNILTTELLAEINREGIRTVYVSAVQGALNTTVPGLFDFDTDSNGRWLAEKYKSLYMFIERESNRIAKDTRRGKGNILLTSSDVAAALNLAGVLDYAPRINTDLLSDDTGPTFAGTLGGKTKVFIDPYATGDFAVVGFKGPSPLDAGLFYCPYIPLQLHRAVDQDSFNAKIGFKTRYGYVANPFAEGLTKGNGVIRPDSNKYYRRTIITNIM